MRREIIQSKTEPNKNNLWLSEEGLKKYGKNGWEPLGGGISPNTPIVDSISGDELVSINVNGENKAVRADELVKGGKEVFIITPDMFDETATIGEASPILIFTDEGWSNFIKAVEANKIIALDFEVSNYILTTASPMAVAIQDGGYLILTALVYYQDDGLVQAQTPSLSTLEYIPAIYEILFENKNVYSNVVSTPSEIEKDGDGTKFLADDGSYKEVGPYIWDGTTSETIFEELNEACVAKRRIILVNDDKYIVFSSFRKLVNNLILIGYPESFGITSTTVVEVATYKESDNSKQISSNKYNDISITSDTNITYNENVVPIQIPIFEGQLFFSDTVYNVTFPDDIKWSTDSVLEYKANHTYQFRIVDNLGVMKEFANA